MALTALELKDKTFATKFRGYNAEEVDDFLDIVTRDYENLVHKNHAQESEIKSLKDRQATLEKVSGKKLHIDSQNPTVVMPALSKKLVEAVAIGGSAAEFFEILRMHFLVDLVLILYH